MSSLLRKHAFDLPPGVIYLDGNSLGPLPRSVPARLQEVVTQEWGRHLIKGWNTAGWMAQPSRVGDRLAPLIGAPQGSVVMGDTLSVKVYQAVAAGLKLNPSRNVVLSDTGNFPTDLYMVEGLLRTLDQGYSLRTVAPDAVAARELGGVRRGLRADDQHRNRSGLRTLLQAREHLAGYKLPRSIDYEQELPRTASGKLYTRRLRDRYWAGRERKI